MKLYGHPLSTCTRKVLLTFSEKNEEAELAVVDMLDGQHKSVEHKKRQPFGVVPALEDGDFSLFESRAIIRYLDAKLAGPRLTPSDTRDRARMDQWMSVEVSYFSAPTMRIVLEKARGEQADAGVIARAKEGVEHALDVVDRALDGRNYLAGDSFTLAEICFMPYLGYLFEVGEASVVAPRRNVASWWNRISERPSWKKVGALR